MTGGEKLCVVTRNLLKNRRFFVFLDGSKSCRKRLKNGLLQGSILASLMFDVNTNDQKYPLGTQYFIYADNLGLIFQHETFEKVEKNLSTALEEMTA